MSRNCWRTFRLPLRLSSVSSNLGGNCHFSSKIIITTLIIHHHFHQKPVSSEIKKKTELFTPNSKPQTQNPLFWKSNVQSHCLRKDEMSHLKLVTGGPSNDNPPPRLTWLAWPRQTPVRRSSRDWAKATHTGR